MTDERTPLIQTVVITHRAPRYSHNVFRRFCTIALGCSLIVVLILFLLPIALLPHNHRRYRHARPHNPGRTPYDSWHSSYAQLYHHDKLPYKDLEAVLLSTPNVERARAWSQYYSSGPHLAGKNLSQAVWTREKWEEFGVKSELVAYDVYLNYPVDHRLALYNSSKLIYDCSLIEDVLEEDPTSGLKDRIPTFHGYSANGNVTAPYVYVNFGTYWDFDDLIAANVSLEGKIALAKYGRGFRGLKVKRAQDLGMVGVVIYSDPQEDGEITELNGYKPYPDGPARHPSAVQRGSTQFLSDLPGDPTTPGYPSKPGVPRTNTDKSIPRIPSLPISYADALPLLRSLNGHGPKASEFGKFWKGGGLFHKGVEYNIGPTPNNVVLNLYNEQEYVTTPVWNVIGIINGTISDEVIVLGNHRDAWVAGGAGDPNSGSAALNEVIYSFGEALKLGWKPLRTIVFASWDGEEYGLLGSTEWVEEYIPWISKSVVAYLNVDIASVGTRFGVAAAPLLNNLIYNVTSTVPHPGGGSVRDNWSGEIRSMGSGSDFTAFQDFAGIPCLQVEFTRAENGPIYHYHSNYDSSHWMDKFGDPGFHHHVAIAQVWALLAAKLSESPILPMNVTDYALAFQSYVDGLKSKAKRSSIPRFNFDELERAIDRFITASTNFDRYTTRLSVLLDEDVPWWRFWRKIRLFCEVRKANHKYKTIEREFLYEKGLDNRSWFKHVVFAPGRWTGYSGATLPGLVESFEDGNLTNAIRWSTIISSRLHSAAELLEK